MVIKCESHVRCSLELLAHTEVFFWRTVTSSMVSCHECPAWMVTMAGHHPSSRNFFKPFNFYTWISFYLFEDFVLFFWIISTRWSLLARVATIIMTIYLTVEWWRFKPLAIIQVIPIQVIPRGSLCKWCMSIIKIQPHWVVTAVRRPIIDFWMKRISNILHVTCSITSLTLTCFWKSK